MAIATVAFVFERCVVAFAFQTGATVPKMLRAYFDDIYGLLDAVSEGVGRAVAPLHLIKPEHQVRLACTATATATAQSRSPTMR